MGPLREWIIRLGVLLSRRTRARDTELRAELDFHREMLEADLRSRGRDEASARREAILRTGGTAQHLEAYADQRSWRGGESLIQDVRYGIRSFARTPGFTLAALATLALGIAAPTVVLTVAHGVLVRPLPYADPAKLVFVGEGPPTGPGGNIGFGTFTELRDRARTVSTLSAIRSWQTTLVAGEAERLQGMRVSANYFELLGVSPALGRVFTPADDHPDRWRVVLLSDGLWRRRFNADPAVVGRTIRMNDVAFEVIGVMPQGFVDLVSARFYESAELWAPLGYDASLSYACRSCRHLKAVGRLAPDATVASAAAELNGIRSSLASQFPADYGDAQAAVVPLSSVIAGDVRRPLLMLAGGATFVLLIACANVASLLLARGSSRTRELAVRAALGAGRGRILRQLVTESLLLWTMGGLAGAGLAALGIRALVGTAPVDLPRSTELVSDIRILCAALVVSGVTGLLFGLVPAAGASRTIAGPLSSARGSTAGSTRIRQGLIVADLAVALVLLVGAGLVTKSVVRLLNVNPGFDPSGVLTANFSLVGTAYRDAAPVRTFIDRVVERVSALPGVEAAAVAGQIPMGGNRDQFGIYIEGLEPQRGGDAPSAERYSVTPDYFRVMRIPLIRGRLIAPTDTAGSEPVMLVSETAARTLFAGGEVLGRRVRVGGSPGTPWRTIVGIVGDVRHADLSEATFPQMYLPQSQFTDSFLVVAARTTLADPAVLTGEIRGVLRELDPSVPMYDVATLDRLVAASTARRRFVSGLLGGFSITSLLLAAVGLYGVVSYAVARRTREMGVRIALGAGRLDVVRVVMRSASVTIVAGLAIGFVLSLPAGRILETELYGVRTVDPLVLAGAVGTLLLVAVAAHVGPLRRALRVDPTIALRED